MRSYILVLGLLSVLFTAFGQSEQFTKSFAAAEDRIAAYQFRPALDFLSMCYDEDAYNPRVLNKMAYCFRQLGREPDAVLYYQETLKVDSTNLQALAALGNIFEKQSRFQQASDIYGRLVTLDSTNSYYFKRFGLTRLNMSDLLGAIGFLYRAHQLNSNDTEVIDRLSDIFLVNGQLEPAEELLRKGLNVDPNNIRLLYNQARLHQKRAEHEGVVLRIERAMELGDTTDYYQMMAGVALLRLDSAERAVNHLQAVIDRGRGTPNAYHYLGVGLLQLDRYSESEAALRMAIEKGVSEKMGTFQSDLANNLEKQGKLRDAIEHYQLAIDFERKPRTLFRLARVSDTYYKDKKIAKKYYEQYLASGDTLYKRYSEARIQQLQEELHFRGNR